uniref:Secreted protein n=1 Tax=Haematobia irritans TaxID=7368 RepID=A0A1L8E783_HAEIR
MSSKLYLLFLLGVVLMSLISMGLAQNQGEWGGSGGRPGQQGHPGQWDNYGNPPWSNNQNGYMGDQGHHHYSAAAAPSTWSMSSFYVITVISTMVLYLQVCG